MLQEELPGMEVRLQEQLHLDEEERITIKPDIVIYSKEVARLVLDTKYKIDEKPSTDDIFQLNSYMKKLHVNGVLIYPTHLISETMYHLGPKVLHERTIDLDRSQEQVNNWPSGSDNKLQSRHVELESSKSDLVTRLCRIRVD